MSEARFYYIGQPDWVKHFNCNGRVQEWRNDEDLWCKHTK